MMVTPMLGNPGIQTQKFNISDIMSPVQMSSESTSKLKKA